ncbi:MAG: HNH endonuclease [Verrucomicrobiales bacterium]|nr:HNH endonuclease [Verrucomicrobiales bacterium]
MNLLAYWKLSNYRRDLDQGAGFNFNSKQLRLHSAINIGETLWLFTRIIDRSGLPQLKIAAKLVVRSKTINPPGYKYGPYRLWGNLSESAYFRIDEDPKSDAFDVLKFLPLDSGTLAGTDRTSLLHACQTIRGISPDGHAILEEFTKHLALEMRAYKVADELRLEKLYQQDLPQFESFLREEHTGVSPERQRELTNTYSRNRQLVSDLIEVYSGRCQLCGFDPPTLYSVQAAEAHHIVYRSRGGEDALDNLVLLCPNHHTVIHKCDATFDYQRLNFCFPNGRVEPLCINQHLEPRSVA